MVRQISVVRGVWGDAVALFEARESHLEHRSTDMSYQRGRRVVDAWLRESGWARENLDQEALSRLADMFGGVADAVQEGSPDHFDPDVERQYEKNRKRGFKDRSGEPLSWAGILLMSALDAWVDNYELLGKISKPEFSKLVKLCVKALEDL